MNLPTWIKKADLAIMQVVNRRWSNDFFDAVLPWMRNQVTWYPFYLFLLVFALLNFGRKGFYWMLGFVSSVAIADQVSSQLFKYWFARIRPCRDPEVMNLIMLRIPNCSGGYSFTSSHAATHFAMATFIFLTLRAFLGKHTAWIFAWAGLVSYAQVYVGVHYPLDILGGALVGLGAGSLTSWLFRKEVTLELRQA